MITSDGRELGEAKEVGESSFRIDAPWRRDYWLDLKSIESGTAVTVLLRATKDEVAAFKVRPPTS